MLAFPLISHSHAKNLLNEFPVDKTKVPLGLDAHSVRGMKWKAKQLIDYANDLNMDSLLLNGLEYFESLEDDFLKELKKLMDKNGMSFYFGVGGLSINSPSYSSEYGTPRELITQGIRLAKIFDSSSVNCRIGSFKDRYTDGGIIARMEEIIKELRSMRSQIQDAGLKFAVENHAGDMRSEELLYIVETVGADICGVMLDPGNAAWAMEDPMNQIKKLGKHVLCTSIRDYRICQSENGATLQWTAIGEGSMDFVKYTEMMSEYCPGIPLQIETISNLRLEIPFLKSDFWAGYPDLKASGLLDFYSMVRNAEPIEKLADLLPKDQQALQQEIQKQELLKSIDFLRKNCGAIQSRKK
jgi:3-oxoisoapionate decarboxylase